MDQQLNNPLWLSKRLKILLILFVVTLLGALATIFLGVSPPSTTVKPSGNQGGAPNTAPSPSTPTETLAVTGPSYLVVEDIGNKWRAILYDIASGKTQKMEQMTTYPLESGKLTAFGSPGSVQWSNDGKIFAYSINDPPGGHGYEGTPKSYQLFVLRNGKTEIVLKDIEDFQTPSRWLMAPDGSSIVYVRTNAEDKAALASAPSSLYRYDVDTKKHTKLVDNFTKFDSGEPFFVNTTTIAFLRPEEDKLYLYAHDLAANKGEDKLIFERKTSGQKYSLSLTEIAISPDQKLTALRILEDGVWKVKLLHSDAGSISDLITVAADRSANDFVWSPDNKSIAFETTLYAAGSPAGRTEEVWNVEVATKKKTVIDTHTRGGEGFDGFTTLGWSPDGKYLAYLQATKLYFYDTGKKEKQLIYNFIDHTHPSGIQNFGWVGYSD